MASSVYDADFASEIVRAIDEYPASPDMTSFRGLRRLTRCLGGFDRLGADGPAQDLARTRLRQLIDERHPVGSLVRGETGTAEGHDLLGVCLGARLQGDEGGDVLAAV